MFPDVSFIRKMKKIMKRVAGMALTGVLLWSPFAVETSAAELDPIKEKSINTPIMWGPNELYPTQTGRLVFLKDVKLYKRNDDGTVTFHRVAKKGSMWRVYNFYDYNTIYNLGGGVRVLKSNLSKYESADEVRARHQGSATVSIKHSDHISYPQLSGLANKTAEKTINTIFENIGNEVKKEQQSLLKQYGQDSKNRQEVILNHTVTYNLNNKLSIVIDKSKIVYKDGLYQSWIPSHKVYTFDLSTGKQIYLKDLLTTKEQIEKVNEYMKERYGYADGINLSRDEFYFVDRTYSYDGYYLSPEEFFGIYIKVNDPKFTQSTDYFGFVGGSAYIPKEIYN